MPERRPTVETETGYAGDGELHRQASPFLPLDSHREPREPRLLLELKGDGVARRLMRVFVEPEAIVFWFQGPCAPVLDQANAAVFASVRISDPPRDLLICCCGRRLKSVAIRPSILNHIAGSD